MHNLTDRLVLPWINSLHVSAVACWSTESLVDWQYQMADFLLTGSLTFISFLAAGKLLSAQLPFWLAGLVIDLLVGWLFNSSADFVVEWLPTSLSNWPAKRLRYVPFPSWSVGRRYRSDERGGMQLWVLCLPPGGPGYATNTACPISLGTFKPQTLQRHFPRSGKLACSPQHKYSIP